MAKRNENLDYLCFRRFVQITTCLFILVFISGCAGTKTKAEVYDTKAIFLFALNSKATLGEIQRILLDEKYHDQTVYNRMAIHLNRVHRVNVVNELMLNFLREKGISPQYISSRQVNRDLWVGPVKLMQSRGKKCSVPTETIEHLTLRDYEFEHLKSVAASVGIDWLIGFEITQSGWMVKPQSDGHFSGFQARWRMVIVDTISGREHRYDSTAFQETTNILFFPGLGLNLSGIQVTPFHGKVDKTIKMITSDIVNESRRAFSQTTGK